MSEWGQTKAKIYITHISTTFMKEPKSNSMQRGVQRLVFLNLGGVHDLADLCVVVWS
jgi:hypothetical protein